MNSITVDKVNFSSEEEFINFVNQCKDVEKDLEKKRKERATEDYISKMAFFVKSQTLFIKDALWEKPKIPWLCQKDGGISFTSYDDYHNWHLTDWVNELEKAIDKKEFIMSKPFFAYVCTEIRVCYSLFINGKNDYCDFVSPEESKKYYDRFVNLLDILIEKKV